MRRKTGKLRRAGLLLMLLATFSSVCLMYSRFILPPALLVSRNLALTYVNKCINASVAETEKMLGTDIGSICSITHDTNGQITSITADGMAVNRFCGGIAENLSCALNSSESVIYIKAGTLTGIPLLSDTGPRVPIKIKCTGGASADYETEVKGVGINQVSFRLFINIHAKIEAYNPLINNEIDVTRRIMIADTVYAGKVPQAVGIGALGAY